MSSTNIQNPTKWRELSAIVIVIVVIVIICVVVAKFMNSSPTPAPLMENFIQELYTVTNQIPVNAKCKTSTLPDQSVDAEVQKLVATGTVDPITVKAYTKALADYKSALAAYNALPICGDFCVGGAVDVNGNCICPASNPIPYLHSDGKVYCVKDDLVRIPNSSFDPATSTFNCNTGFVRDATTTNNCYSTGDATKMATYTTNLVNSLAAINRAPTSIMRSYGSIFLTATLSGNAVTFFITPQASLPTANLSVVEVPSTYKGPIQCTADCASAAATLGANVFSWNPQTKVCVLYKGAAVPLGSLDNGILTVGSVNL